MSRLLAAFLLCIPVAAHADAFICTPQAITGVAYVDGRYVSTELRTEGSAFYMAEDGGVWSVKLAGYRAPFVSQCVSAMYCRSEAGWFTRDAAKGTFVAQWHTEVSRDGGPSAVGHLIAGGICKSI